MNRHGEEAETGRGVERDKHGDRDREGHTGKRAETGMRPRQRGGEKERDGDRDEAVTESDKDLIIWTGQKGNTGGLRQRVWREVVQTETGEQRLKEQILHNDMMIQKVSTSRPMQKLAVPSCND